MRLTSFRPSVPIVRAEGKNFVFETSCMCARGQDINDMRDHAQNTEVSYRTFRRRCAGLQDAAYALGYGRDLPLSKDPYVAYYKSVYRERACYYMVQSAIEYIWVK